ncbi:RadC family protein [Helicovermis profundi]|uniref:DNA repair protein RadC n=1 Tax=Helicovermis profundi TaxID=3065157 RepID=A0AAU9EXZ5_9FIRM|nr:DNA repair protein RadC [Clostridia bacterium S502]
MDIVFKNKKEFERPRERAMLKGVNSLSVNELISIILSSGSKSKNVYDISNEIIDMCSNLEGLNNITVDELCTINGLGKIKALKVICAVELGKRVVSYKKEVRKKITSPTDIVEELVISMQFLKKEEFRSVLLDTKNSIISIETISIGSLNSSIVHPREVFNLAVRKSAASIILVHNHPSGNTNPSEEDRSITKRLKKAGKILGIEILDHIIIGNSKYFSFREHDILDE